MELENYGIENCGHYPWQYWTVTEYLRSPELGLYKTYGILAVSAEPEGWVKARMIHDVATDGETVQRIAELFTKHQLLPIHLCEAVEDMLQ